ATAFQEAVDTVNLLFGQFLFFRRIGRGAVNEDMPYQDIATVGHFPGDLYNMVSKLGSDGFGNAAAVTCLISRAFKRINHLEHGKIAQVAPIGSYRWVF